MNCSPCATHVARLPARDAQRAEANAGAGELSLGSQEPNARWRPPQVSLRMQAPATGQLAQLSHAQAQRARRQLRVFRAGARAARTQPPPPPGLEQWTYDSNDDGERIDTAADGLLDDEMPELVLQPTAPPQCGYEPAFSGADPASTQMQGQPAKHNQTPSHGIYSRKR